MQKRKDLLKELRSKSEGELQEIVRDTITQLNEKRVMRHFESAQDVSAIRSLKARLSRAQTVLTEGNK